jgi:hypothetical protein
MKEPVNAANREQPRRAWLLLALTLTFIGVVACGLAIFFATRPPAYAISPTLQQQATQALNNPAGASIDLDQHYSGWYPPSGDAYALSSSLVIFPQSPRRRGPIRDVYADVLPDKEMPALVYAPDGRDLSTEGRDIERGWYYIGEWDLFDCYPVNDVPFWWQCTLVVGGNI